MGFWKNIKTALQAARTEPHDGDRETAADSPPLDPAVPSQNPEHEQNQAKYAHQKAAAREAGQTVKGYKAGYIGVEETRAVLENLTSSSPELKIIRSANGLDLALHGGRLIDYKTLALRRWSICGFRVVGMSHYEDPEKPFISAWVSPEGSNVNPKMYSGLPRLLLTP